MKQAAQNRLDNAADLMAKQLLGIALTADSEGVMLAAVRDALDRTIGKAPNIVEIGPTKAYETVFDSIGGNPPEDWITSAGQSSNLPTQPNPATGEPGDQAATREYAVSTSFPEGSESSPDVPPRQGTARDRDRERQRQPRERHITGDEAIRAANAANRAAGVFDEQLAIESAHKRYLRP